MYNATAVRADESNIVDFLVDSRAGKYLTFFLSGQEYGVEILKVQERSSAGCRSRLFH